MSRTVFWFIGGLLCAIGVFSLMFSFGGEYGDFAMAHGGYGGDAMGDVKTTGFFPVAVLCIGLGAPILIALNATAWRKSGGY